MTLDFNTPVCQHFSHRGQGIPAVFRLEHTKYGVKYFCGNHSGIVMGMHKEQNWTITRIDQYTQPAREQHVDR